MGQPDAAESSQRRASGVRADPAFAAQIQLIGTRVGEHVNARSKPIWREFDRSWVASCSGETPYLVEPMKQSTPGLLLTKHVDLIGVLAPDSM